MFTLYLYNKQQKFTYDKSKSVKFGFSIFDSFSQVLLDMFTFLINIIYKEIKTFLQMRILTDGHTQIEI